MFGRGDPDRQPSLLRPCCGHRHFVAAACPRLPFCPQPPAANLFEVTLGQFNEPESRQQTTLHRFTQAALAGAFPAALALKTQVTGPITLAGLLGLQGGDARTAHRVTSLASSVARIAAEQVRTLAVAGLPVLVFVDEPALIMAEESVAKRLLAVALHGGPGQRPRGPGSPQHSDR